MGHLYLQRWYASIPIQLFVKIVEFQNPLNNYSISIKCCFLNNVLYCNYSCKHVLLTRLNFGSSFVWESNKWWSVRHFWDQSFWKFRENEIVRTVFGGRFCRSSRESLSWFWNQVRQLWWTLSTGKSLASSGFLIKFHKKIKSSQSSRLHTYKIITIFGEIPIFIITRDLELLKTMEIL